MKKANQFILFFLFVLVLSSLACNFGSGLLGNANPEDLGISAEDISLAATRAAEVAATAAAAVEQEASQLPATAVATEQAPAGDATTAGGTLQQKLANIQPDANGNFSVAVTEADLNEFVGEQGGGIQSEGLSAQNIGIQIKPDHLELTGDVTEPIALPLAAKLLPEVSGGQLRFKLLSASAGIFPVPDSMLDLIEAGVNLGLGQALTSLPAGATLQDATLANDVLTIIGQQK